MPGFAVGRLVGALDVVLAKASRRFAFLGVIRDYLRHALRRRRYGALCNRTSIDPRLIVFESYAGRGYACSPRAIYEAMLSDDRFRDCRFVWAFRGHIVSALARGGFTVASPWADQGSRARELRLERLFGSEALTKLRHAALVPYDSQAYDQAHARAGFWVANCIAPPHLTLRPGQVYLQTWHGSPLKRLGCDVALRGSRVPSRVRYNRVRFRHEGTLFTHLVSPSPFASRRLATAFDLAGNRRRPIILEVGYPRNDFLRNATAAQTAAVRERFGIPAGKRVILYAPTFRDDQHLAGVGHTYRLSLDIDLLRSRLGDDAIILFRAHYLVASRFDFSAHRGFVRDVSGAAIDINHLCIVSSALVTDYSSVLFDYLSLDRPMVFFLYDCEEYAQRLRGFYLDLEELPGPIVRTSGELADALCPAALADPRWASRRARFRSQYACHDDGHAARRVIDRVFARVLDGSQAGLPGEA